MTSAGAAPLWLVRHARPLVAEGVCYGASDIPADAEATQRCAVLLAQVLPAHTRVLSSPLQRCTQLAQALVQVRTDLCWTSDHRLAEMDFGVWEGWRWADIPKAALDQWVAEFGSWRFGGRESVDAVMSRVAAAWHEARSSAVPTAWLCHAGVARAAQLIARGQQAVHSSADWPQQGLAFGEFVRL